MELLLLMLSSGFLLAVLTRYLMGLGPIAPFVLGPPVVFGIQPALILWHHNLRMLPSASGQSRGWKIFGLGAVTLVLSWGLAFLIYDLIFPPYHYGPGP